MRQMKISIFLLILMMVDLISGCRYSEDTFTKEVSAEALKSTIVTPYYEYKIDQSKNIVFCSTFQMAWNKLKDNIVKSNIKLSNEPPLVSFLNTGKSSKKDLSDKDFVALAGFQKDNIINKINDELKAKFKEDAPTVSPDTLKNPEDILVYAYLFKNLKFKQTFEALKNPIEFYNGSKRKVKAFGIEKYSNNKKHEELGKQVDIYRYQYIEGENRYNFIVKLNSQSQNDEIILALIKQKESLVDTINYVSSIIAKESPSKMAKNDRLAIPVINFNVLKLYNELTDKNLMNARFSEYRITEALQSIKFKFDEKGAVLKSKAKINLKKSASAEIPKMLIFNEPFLLYLKEKNADHPYFAMWVNNTELLNEAK